MKGRGTSGAFSLVEVILAIGVMAFALLALFALLPVGAESNQNSAEATRAVGILTLLEADLRNSHPASPGGKSQIFGLNLPYASAGSGIAVNPALTNGMVDSTGLDDAEQKIPLSTSPRARFQASVIYVQVPTNASAPVLARLVVGWPAQVDASPENLTAPSKTRGFAEAFVTFPSP